MPAPGLVIDWTGVDRASSYQNLREQPNGRQRSCPSDAATIGANARPKVGRPTTMSQRIGASRSASISPSDCTTVKAAWFKISDATACEGSPARRRIGSIR